MNVTKIKLMGHWGQFGHREENHLPHALCRLSQEIMLINKPRCKISVNLDTVFQSVAIMRVEKMHN